MLSPDFDAVIPVLCVALAGLVVLLAESFRNQNERMPLAGLPIIANDLPFLRSVIAAEDFGIVHALDGESAYAEAINIMFDPAANHPTRFRARILARQDQYSWENEEHKILDLYRHLSSPNQVPPQIEKTR